VHFDFCMILFVSTLVLQIDAAMHDVVKKL
jgi:hypothetical protein